MQYLHEELKVYHRDLKHENILMGYKIGDPYNEDERQPTIKVTDFTTVGRLWYPKAKESIKAGTEQFFAPEIYSGKDFLVVPVDVWAFAITIYVYLTNKLPFSDNDALSISKHIQ